MPLPTEEDLIKKNPRQDINQQLTNIAGQSSFQDWITLKDRNAIPNNAPSLVWLDVKPGKRIQSQPFTINDEGMRVSYTNSYWNDPKRVARMHEVIDSAPQGWQAPEWLDVEGVENLYRYFEYRNPGKTWDKWGELPGDDPGIDLANYLDQPPQDVLHYDDMDPQYRAYRKIQDWYDKQLEAETKYQEALEQNNQMAAQVIEQQYKQDLVARWDDLEPWQQFLMARDSITPIEGRPEWTVGTAAGWMGAKTALSIFGLSTLFFGGIGTLAAPGPGTVAGALAGLAAGAYTGYKAYMGEENEIAKILNVFNLPPELVERFAGLISMQTELASQGKTFADVGGIIPAWQASKSAYEAQTIPIGNWEANAVSKVANAINPEWSSGLTANLSAGEVWKFEQGYVVPQVVEGGTMAGEALLEATMRINNGEDVTFVYEDMVHKYGYSGTRADFIAQNFLDPMQFVPYIINRAGANIAGKIGDQVLRQKFIDHRGSILIDALPMGWQQLATGIGGKWGWRSTGGIFDVLQDYGGALRNLTMAPDGSYTMPENFSKFQIAVGQLALNKDGHLQPRITIPDSELATPTNRILKALDWAGRNTPETKAIMAQTNLSSAIDYILDLYPDNPMKIDEIMHAIIDRDTSKFQDIAGPYLASPELESIRGALREFVGSKAYEHELKIWAGTQIKRQMLEELAVAATHDLAEPITAAKVMDMLRAGETDDLIDLIKTNPRTNNGIVAKYKHGTNPETEYLDSQRYISKDMIEKRLSTFIKGNVPWHPREFSARLMNKMIDHSTNYFIKRYDLKADSTVKRLSTLMKSTQSLYLMGLSPNFLVANAIDGIVTTSYYGVLGAKPLSQLDKFWVENELAKPARMGDAYGPGDVTHSIYTQLNPKDIISEAQSIVSKVNKNLGIFTRLSNNIERIQGANAITLGAMHYLKNNWTEGAGFGKMPADLEAKVRAAGIDPDTIYAMARSSKTPSDFDKKFYGAFREGTIGEALAEGAKRPKPPEGPAPTPEETLAKFDNAVKENADEFYTLDGQALTTELIDKTGVGEMIADNIRSGMDGDAAIGSALTMVEESLERQRWEDRLTRIESDNARMTAEGFKAAVEVFGEQIAENDFKSTALDFELTKEFDEVYRLKEMGLNTEANAWMVEVVEEVQRKIKIQAEENRLRIATLMNRLDPDNPLQLKISENLMQIGNAWEEFYANKVKLWEEFHETTRSMGWDEERYAVMKKELSDKLTTMAKDTRAFESGIQKNLDEYYVELIGRTDTQREKVRTWLSAVRNLEASRNEMKTDVFRRMAEDPANANKIYNEYMRGDYMPVSSKIQDAYAVGATRLTQEEGPIADFTDKHTEDMLRQADIEMKPQTKKPKAEAPEAETPKAKSKNEFIKRDDVDAKIERTIYLDESMAIRRDTETRLRIQQFEEAYLERIKKAIPDMTNNRGKQRLAMTWMRMRAETWAIDNDSTPLEYWRVYADIDNVKNTSDALSNYIRDYNATDPEKPIVASTDIRQADGFIRATMRATKAANFETFVHEMIHPMMYMVDDVTLDILAKYGGLADADEYKSLLALRDTGNLKADPELSKKLYNADEKIVEGAVRRMNEEDFGSGLSGLLKGAFGKIRAILTNLWKRLKKETPELKFNDNVRKSLDTLILGSEEARRIYNDALENLTIEQTRLSAGTPGIGRVVLGDGNQYPVHYAWVKLSDIKEPQVPPQLFAENKTLIARVKKIQEDSPELFQVNKLSDEERQLVSDYEFQKQLHDQEVDYQLTRMNLEEQLKELQAQPPFKGRGPQIDELEADIRQLTPLNSDEYERLLGLNKRKANLIPVRKGDTNAKTELELVNENIAPLEERLKRFGDPDTRSKFTDLQDKVAKIKEALETKETDRKKMLSTYDEAMKRLDENRKAIEEAKRGKQKNTLEDLKRKVPADALDPKSRVPLITRDGSRLYDGTGLISQLKKAIVGTLVKAEDITYKLDPERQDFVGIPPSNNDSLHPFEDNAMRYDFTDQPKERWVPQTDTLNYLSEYRKYVEDTQSIYGLHLTHEEIYGEPGVIALIPEVDPRKFNDVNDLKKMLGWLDSSDRPIVYGKFVSELDSYLKTKPNVLAQAYMAKITEAMVRLAYWDPYANKMEGGWVSIADPRASKTEIEAAIQSERQAPFLGIESGVLDTLEYALRVSSLTNETEQFAYHFLREPIQKFFESDRAAASKKVNYNFETEYKATDERLMSLDYKIHEMVSKIEGFADKTVKYPSLNDVVRSPFADLDKPIQTLVSNQMKKYQVELGKVVASTYDSNIKDFARILKNRPAGAESSSESPFLQSVKGSFIENDNTLRNMYRSKQISLDQISEALSDITAGKYDPDSGLHQRLLRSALRDNLEEPIIYNWLGVWKFETHSNRINRLKNNVTDWAINIDNAINTLGDTSKTDVTTNIWNQYKNVAAALKRTKDSGLTPLLKTEMAAIKDQMAEIKKTIQLYSKYRSQYDKRFRGNKNAEPEITTKDMDQILADNKELSRAVNANVQETDNWEVEEGWDDLPAKQPEAQPVKLTDAQIKAQKKLKSDMNDLATYNFTPFMMSLLEPKEIAKLQRKLVALESKVPLDQEITGEVRANIKALIHEEYYKMTQAIQEKSRTEQATAGDYFDESKRIQQSRGTQGWLNLKDYQDWIEEQRKGFIDNGQEYMLPEFDRMVKEQNIKTEDDVVRYNENWINELVEEPVRELVRQLIREGKRTYSSNAYNIGPKGVFWMDERGEIEGSHFVSLEQFNRTGSTEDSNIEDYRESPGGLQKYRDSINQPPSEQAESAPEVTAPKTYTDQELADYQSAIRSEFPYFTQEMIDNLTPEDMKYLVQKSISIDSTQLNEDTSIKHGKDYYKYSDLSSEGKREIILEEYNKIIENRKPPAPPEESGYATQMKTYDRPPYDKEKKYRTYPYPYGREVGDYSYFDYTLRKMISPDTAGLYDFTKMQSEAKAIFIAKDFYRYMKHYIELVNGRKELAAQDSEELKLWLGKLNEVGKLANKNNYTEAYNLIQQINSIFTNKFKLYTSLDHLDPQSPKLIKLNNPVYLDDLDNVISVVAPAEQPSVSTPAQARSQQSTSAPAPKQQMMNNPTGSTPIPMMTGYAGLEVFDMDLYPLLSSIRDRMRKDMRSYKIDNLNTLDVDTRKAFQDWLNTTRINLAETRRNAVDWGIMQRDNALLNYSNRTNLDSYLEMIFPYQFWFTRSLGNWAKRMVSKPAMVGQMVRRQEMMKKNGEFWGKLPKRLQGKMVIPHAFSEPWMGNFMFINPWQNLYPPFNLLSSVNSFNMLANNVNPVYTLQDMVSEGQITQEEMDEAIEKQSGTNWDKAYARAIEENHADLKNPVTLASMMLSPSLWITEMFGDKPAENWPSTKTGTAVRALGKKVPGILGPVSDMLATALEAPEKLVRKNNFAYYGEYGDYKVNRMIANMVADGTFDYDRGMLAMINKSGPDYELATQRLENELSMKVAGSALADTIAAQEWTQIPLATLVTLFPGGLYPIGEEEGMQLKEQMTAAWEELGKGNPYPINNFFNEHEGHLVRTGINDGPELQMKKFLAHNIREKYDALDPVNKGLVKVQLGEGFVSSLLSGSIDYEKLTKQDLTIWLDALGGNVPETEVIPQTQRVAPNVFTDGEVKEITTYLDMRERLYPNHAWLQQNYGELANEIARKKYLAKFPELKHYWDWNRKYKYDHPIIGEWSSYYGNSDVGTTYRDPYFGLDKNVIQGYLDEKRQRFPDLEWQQEVYFSLPTDEERYAFADANPSLIEAWDWDKAVVANNPTVEMYKQLKEAQYSMASNSPGTPKTPAQVSKNLALLDIHPFAIQELVIRHSTGAALSAGTKAELLRLFRSLGSPGGKLEDWIDSLF